VTTHPPLGDTLALATIAHAGQMYGDRPYIEHPIAVAALLLPLTFGVGPLSADALHAALLHDAVEDTTLTLADLDDFGYPECVVGAVDSVTRRPGEQYANLIARAAAHSLGRYVKLADNTHNRSTLPEGDSRWYRYNRAHRILVSAIGFDPWPDSPSE